MTKEKVVLAILGLALATGGVAAAEPWLHVHVVEAGDGGETVRVNLPLDLVEKILPLIHHDPLHDGKVRIEMGDAELSAADLRKIWEAVRASKDAQYVSVDGPDETVRVAKKGDEILVRVDGKGDEAEKVEVRIPLEVVDALFSSPGEELDLRAAVQALARRGTGEIVTVHDEDSRVRIWIDTSEEGL